MKKQKHRCGGGLLLKYQHSHRLESPHYCYFKFLPPTSATLPGAMWRMISQVTSVHSQCHFLLLLVYIFNHFTPNSPEPVSVIYCFVINYANVKTKKPFYLLMFLWSGPEFGQVSMWMAPLQPVLSVALAGMAWTAETGGASFLCYHLECLKWGCRVKDGLTPNVWALWWLVASHHSVI